MKKLFALLLLFPVLAQAELIYRVTTEINGQEFQDIMTIKNLPFPNGKISGSLTVPGQFSYPFKESSRLQIALWADRYFFSLDVNVTENGESSDLSYKLESIATGYQMLKGELLNSEGTVIGTIKEMRLIYESDH